jgi:hypothetical protein
MKYAYSLSLFFTISLLLNSIPVSAQFSPFSKGYDDGSLYLSCYWKNGEFGAHRGILYLTEDGEKFQWKSEGQFWLVMPGYQAGNMFVITASGKHMAQSHDYGNTFGENLFEFNGSIMQGYQEDEFILYKPDFDTWPFSGNLLKSNNSGQTFDTTTRNLPYFFYISTGTENGSLYGLMDYWFMYSPDFGNTIDSTLLDESMFPNYYCHTRIVPGAGAGEIYLVGWDFGIKYLIYRSNDYGKKFEKVYTSDSIHPYHINNVYFTAGNEPGEFYTAFDRPDSLPDLHSNLIIGHSTDGAGNFTFYTHDLSSFSSGLENNPLTVNTMSWELFPNPATNYIELQFHKIPQKDSRFFLTDLLGKVIWDFEIRGMQHGLKDFRISIPTFIKDGLYLLRQDHEVAHKILIQGQ